MGLEIFPRISPAATALIPHVIASAGIGFITPGVTTRDDVLLLFFCTAAKAKTDTGTHVVLGLQGWVGYASSISSYSVKVNIVFDSRVLSSLFDLVFRSVQRQREQYRSLAFIFTRLSRL